MRRDLPWLLAASLATAIAGCDRQTSRPEPLDGRDAGFDLGPLDAVVDPPDARPDAAPDARLDARPDAAPDARPDAANDAFVCPPFAAPPPAGDGLPDLRLRAALSMGAPPGDGALWAGDLDGDGAPEVAVIRGGRLEVAAAAGPQWWRTAVLDLERIVGPADLDGDGRLELVAAARRSVLVFDGLTGVSRWSLPDAPFGEGDPAVAIQQARLLDLDGDGLDDLYVTDSGCGDAGSGRGLVWSFADGFDAPPAGRIEGPRLNGRCTRWHGFADLDGDGRSEVLVTDGEGLNGFALDGARRWCGRFDAPPNGPLPHLAADGGWFVFLPGAVARVEVTDDPECGGALSIRWQAALDARPEGSAPRSDDRGPALLTSVFDPDSGRWRAVRVHAEGIAPMIDDARLLGLLGPDRALVAVGDGPSPSTYGALQLYDLTADPPAPLWPLPMPRARALVGPPEPDRTPEFPPLLTLGDDLVVVRSAADDGDLADRIERIGPGGVLRAQHPLVGEPGAIAALDDGLVVAEAGGVIAALDGALRPRFVAEDGRAPVRAAAGAPRLAAAFDGVRMRPVARIGGVVALLDPDRETAPLRWQTVIGSPRRGGSPLDVVPGDGADGVLVRDARAGDAAWSVLDAVDGRRRWQHRLDPALFRPVGEARVVVDDGRAITVARADLILDPAAWPVDDPSCAETRFEVPDPAAPADDCPGFVVKPRAVRGLDPATGACRWRLVLRPAFPCGGPSNQALSAADGDGDGRPELYLTETNAIRRIDPDTGALLDTVDLGFHESGALRGGGWMRGGPAGLARVGGNGPMEVFDADLTPRWQAEHPPALRLQTWIGRDGVVSGDALWMAPAARHPLMAWALADGAPRAAWGLVDGAGVPEAAFAPDFADVRSLAAVADVDGAGGDGLLVTADDGVLYGLTAGGPAWIRPHAAAIGAPIVAAIEVDAARSLMVPTADGQVLVYGPPGPAAPPVAWDLPCPPTPSCDAADDIDETRHLDRLCAAWVPVRAAEGYEVRAVGPNGAVIGPWRAVEAPPIELDGLPLVPGVRYGVEVRTVAAVDGRLTRSAGRRTDGVDVINDGPPEVAVVARPAALVPAEQPVLVAMAAADDDRLAGWRLEVLDAAGGRVRRLAGGPLAAARFETQARWNLEDDAKRLVPPGRYRVAATVVDRAGNTGRAEAPVEVCDGACP